MSVGDEDMQVNYFLKELQDYPGVLSVLMTSHDLKQCSDIVCTEFERPAVNNLDTRYSFAKNFYEQFAGMAVTQIGDTLIVTVRRGNRALIPNGDLVLKEGDTGAGVAAVQVALKYHKIDMGESGVFATFGPETTMGIKDFQRRNGLTATGEVDPDTWGRLML